MKKLNYKDYTIELYEDVSEFINEVIAPPEGWELDEDSVQDVSAYSCLADNTIMIWKSPNTTFESLLLTISHELGHLVTGGFKDNPPDEEGYEDLHEKKAEHYETFVNDSLMICKMIEDSFSKFLNERIFSSDDKEFCDCPQPHTVSVTAGGTKCSLCGKWLYKQNS